MNKKITLLSFTIATTLVLGACTSKTETQDKVAVQSEPTTNNDKVSSPSADVEQTISKENIKADVTQLAKNAFDALVNGDYKAVGQYFTMKQMEISGESIEDFGKKGLATTPDGKEIKYTGYKIVEVTPYDENRVYVQVISNVETENEKAENKGDFMAVFEDGKWRLQTDLFIENIEGLTVERNDNVAIKLTIIEANRRINGIGFKLNLENVYKDKQLGYKDHPFEMHLLTDEGTFSSSLPGINEFPYGAKADLNMIFEGAKGKPLALTFSNVNNTYNIKKDGMPEYKERGGIYFLETITEERVKEIGENLFNYLAKVDLQPDVKTAEEYLKKQFGEVTSQVPKMALESAEFGKYEDVKVTYSNHKVYFNTEYNNIHFEASVIIEYTKLDGTKDTKSYNLNSDIKTNDINGNYSYFYFEIR